MELKLLVYTIHAEVMHFLCSFFSFSLFPLCWVIDCDSVSVGFSFLIRILSIGAHCYIWRVSADGAFRGCGELSSINIFFFWICYTRGFFNALRVNIQLRENKANKQCTDRKFCVCLCRSGTLCSQHPCSISHELSPLLSFGVC